MRRSVGEKGGVIAISDDFFGVVLSKSIHCSVFFFPCLIFHLSRLFRKTASQTLSFGLCVFTVGPA